MAESYASAQLDGLKAAILATGGVALASFLVTTHLPSAGSGRPPEPAPAPVRPGRQTGGLTRDGSTVAQGRFLWIMALRAVLQR